MKIQRFKSIFFLGAAALVLIVGTSQASANNQYVFQTPGPCTYLENGNYGEDGYFFSSGLTRSNYTRTGWCDGTWGRPALQIRYKQDVYSWNGTNWLLCWPASAWKRNAAVDTRVLYSSQAVALCGPTYYQGLGTGHVYNGVQWNGGTLWTGYSVYAWR